MAHGDDSDDSVPIVHCVKRPIEYATLRGDLREVVAQRPFRLVPPLLDQGEIGEILPDLHRSHQPFENFSLLRPAKGLEREPARWPSRPRRLTLSRYISSE